MLRSTEAILRKHVPATAVAYCASLQSRYHFHFRVSRPRRSKWGDYRYRKTGPTATHTITVNENLHPYAFLITYLHEVAHCATFSAYGFRIPPHGTRWKKCFSELLHPVLHEGVFPPQVLQPLRRYAHNPKAATGTDPALTTALQQYDRSWEEILLSSLAPGSHFQFRQRTYRKEKVRRTRSLCIDVDTKKKYLILETTLVSLISYTIITFYSTLSFLFL